MTHEEATTPREFPKGYLAVTMLRNAFAHFVPKIVQLRGLRSNGASLDCQDASIVWIYEAFLKIASGLFDTAPVEPLVAPSPEPTFDSKVRFGEI